MQWFPGEQRRGGSGEAQLQKEEERAVFTGEHFIWIALCGAFVAVMTLISRKGSWTLRRAGCVMTGICIVSEVSKIMSSMEASPYGGMTLAPWALPFHLCSMMIFAVAYITFGREGRGKQVVIDFMAVMGTLGSFCAIMIPTNGTDFTQIDAYQCFVYHAGLLWFSLYLLLSGRARLGGRALLRNLGILTGLAFGMLYVNGALSAYGTNFMYLVRPPMEGLPYLNLEQGWYVYFLRLMALGAALVTLFHLPFLLHTRKKRTETPQKETTAAL